MNVGVLPVPKLSKRNVRMFNVLLNDSTGLKLRCSNPIYFFTKSKTLPQIIDRDRMNESKQAFTQHLRHNVVSRLSAGRVTTPPQQKAACILSGFKVSKGLFRSIMSQFTRSESQPSETVMARPFHSGRYSQITDKSTLYF